MADEPAALKEQIVNLDDIVDRFAEAIYDRNERKDLEKSLGCRLPWGELRREIDTRELQVVTAVPNYEPEAANRAGGDGEGDDDKLLASEAVTVVAQGRALRPSTSSCCAFRTVYTNECPHEIVNHINTSRTTRSSCCYRITRGLVLNQEFGLKLALPQDILELNAGFSAEFSLEKESEKSVESEVTWAINTEIRVPGSRDGRPSRVEAEVVIEENEFKARFTAVTYLSGRIKVRLYTKDNRYLLPIVIPNLRQVFQRNLGFRHPEGSSKVAFVTAGTFHTRFGVSQRVRIVPAADS
ncbi:hypothetical protein BOX15_Mlig016627g1 [Macrostomum lignano]|uniref:Uncharacterized protein n=1 Tax=Macrostomum lignano TaxID=282301 RepID=A0A267EHF2_9PLAT|nr:hypothetical protein BOX15_Mlig016627g2 [Macrostomum lignano]PAA60930.1 hypothetical protein BOX15_Mlig016627g1 [Macrostomum lignano]